MRIGIISRNRRLYSTERLINAARQRGHRVQVIDTIHAARRIGALPHMGVRNLRRSLPYVDAVIPRIGASVTQYGVAVVRRYEGRGTLTTASAAAILQSRDKLQSLQLMRGAGLPLPLTAVVSDADEVAEAVRAVGGPPVVIKVLKGTQGRGVILAENLPTVRAVVNVFFRHRQRPILIQEFIAEAEGQDVRILVVGNRCVAAMRRTAAAGEFRANLHRGGQAVALAPDREMRTLALDAAALHQLGVAGVDIILSQRGPLLLEVNSSPGLEGIEEASQVDIAAEIIRFLEDQRHRRQRRRR
jgi:ribosomal protein S6--L-glutamate ligase